MGYGYGYYPGFYFDPTYILIIIGALISMWASARVKSTFAKYDRMQNLRGMTGAQAAEMILHSAGIYDVSIQRVSGSLTDHYDPSSKILRLSDSVFGRTSVAAICVAAHECGHAIQHDQGYAPLQIRTSLVLARSDSGMESDTDPYRYYSLLCGCVIPAGDIACGV